MGAAVSTPAPAIAASASLSNMFYVGHGRLESIETPSGWTTASLTFQGSYDGTNFFELYDSGNNEITISSVAASTLVQMGTIGATAGLPGALWMKIRSGTAASPTTQTSAVTLNCVVRKLPFPGMHP